MARPLLRDIQRDVFGRQQSGLSNFSASLSFPQQTIAAAFGVRVLLLVEIRRPG